MTLAALWIVQRDSRDLLSLWTRAQVPRQVLVEELLEELYEIVDALWEERWHAPAGRAAET